MSLIARGSILALSLAGKAGSARTPGLSRAPGPQGEHRGAFGVSPGPPGTLLALGYHLSSLSLGLYWLPGSHGAGGRERQKGESTLSCCVTLSHPSGPFPVPHILLCHPLCEPERGWAELKAGEGTQPCGPRHSHATCPLTKGLGRAPSPRGARGGHVGKWGAAPCIALPTTSSFPTGQGRPGWADGTARAPGE